MSSDQEQNTPESSSGKNQSNNQTEKEVKMMTQTEYLKYKQENSNANNYYGFSREVDVKPVAWVCKLESFRIKNNNWPL